MIKTVCAKIGNCGASGGTYADAQEDRARGQRLFGGADAGSADGNEAVGSALSDLASGQVDLMGPLLKNAATEEMFEFPENSYGTVYTTLVALVGGAVDVISSVSLSPVANTRIVAQFAPRPSRRAWPMPSTPPRAAATPVSRPSPW